MHYSSPLRRRFAFSNIAGGASAFTSVSLLKLSPFTSPCCPFAAKVTRKYTHARRVISLPTLTMSLPQNVERISIPFFVKDMVTVKNPDVIRKLASSQDIGRPAEAQLPWVFRYWFASTKFYYPPTEKFFIAQEGDEKNDRPQRRKVVEEQLAAGFTEQHIAKLTELIKGHGDLTSVGKECAKIIGDLILPLNDGETIPDDVASAACTTAVDPTSIFNPFAYFRGWSSRRKVESYVRSKLPHEVYIGDYAHNLGAAAQGLGLACLRMRNLHNNDVRVHFCNNPLTTSTLRVPMKTTTLDGTFPDDAPLTTDSIIVLEISAAAKETHDDLFLFASGVDHRQCPFKNLFFESTTEIQRRL